MSNFFSGLGNFLTGGIVGQGIFGTDKGGIVSSVPEALDSYFGVTSNRIAAQNLAYQKEYNQMLLDRQDAYNKTIFEREDNAYQRAMADIAKTGLSKTLALTHGGSLSGGSAGAVPSGISAPSRENTGMFLGNALSNVVSLASVLSQAKLNSANADRTDLLNDIDSYDFHHYADYGLSKNQTDMASVVTAPKSDGVSQVVEDIEEAVAPVVKKVVEKVKPGLENLKTNISNSNTFDKVLDFADTVKTNYNDSKSSKKVEKEVDKAIRKGNLPKNYKNGGRAW